MTSSEGPSLNRRTFLKSSAVAGGGLVLGVHFSGCSSDASLAGDNGLSPDAWLQITPDNRVIFQLDKAEMGQGVSTALPTLVGEELELDPARIHVHLAPVHPDFQDPLQVTGGSTSTATRWEPLRMSGAAAREMLRSAAAAEWAVPVAEVVVRDGRIRHSASGRDVSYGDMAEAAAHLSVPSEPPLKAPADFRWIGRSLPRNDRVGKSTGTALFGIDTGMGDNALPGLVSAVVVRSPRFGAELTGFDDRAGARGCRCPGRVRDQYWRRNHCQRLLAGASGGRQARGGLVGGTAAGARQRCAGDNTASTADRGNGTQRAG